MLLIDIIPAGGLGRAEPLRLQASQMVVRTANGTPICVVDESGPDGTYRVTSAGDPDRQFDNVLRELGLQERVECSEIIVPGSPTGIRRVIT